MRQNFVLKKNEEKGKKVAAIIFDVLFWIELCFGFLVWISFGTFEGALGFWFMGIIFVIIQLCIESTMQCYYHGCFGINGFSVECRTTKYDKFGFQWDVIVNGIQIPRINAGKKSQYYYTCTINDVHKMSIKCESELTENTVSIKIDSVPVVENDVVYVDLIKQMLNL